MALSYAWRSYPYKLILFTTVLQMEYRRDAIEEKYADFDSFDRFLLRYNKQTAEEFLRYRYYNDSDKLEKLNRKVPIHSDNKLTDLIKNDDIRFIDYFRQITGNDGDVPNPYRGMAKLHLYLCLNLICIHNAINITTAMLNDQFYRELIQDWLTAECKKENKHGWVSKIVTTPILCRTSVAIAFKNIVLTSPVFDALFVHDTIFTDILNEYEKMEDLYGLFLYAIVIRRSYAEYTKLNQLYSRYRYAYTLQNIVKWGKSVPERKFIEFSAIGMMLDHKIRVMVDFHEKLIEEHCDKQRPFWITSRRIFCCLWTKAM